MNAEVRVRALCAEHRFALGISLAVCALSHATVASDAGFDATIESDLAMA